MEEVFFKKNTDTLLHCIVDLRISNNLVRLQLAQRKILIFNTCLCDQPRHCDQPFHICFLNSSKCNMLSLFEEQRINSHSVIKQIVRNETKLSHWDMLLLFWCYEMLSCINLTKKGKISICHVSQKCEVLSVIASIRDCLAMVWMASIHCWSLK